MGNKKYMQIKVNKHYYRINRTEDNLSPSGIILSRTNDSQFVEILDNDLYEMGILTRLAGPKEYIERELISALLPKGKDPEILSNWCICGNNTLISCKPSAFENKSKLGLILIESQDMNKHKCKKLKFTVEAHGIDSDLNFEACILSKEILKEIALICDILYTDFGFDVHSNTMKSEPFNTLKVIKTRF